MKPKPSKAVKAPKAASRAARSTIVPPVIKSILVAIDFSDPSRKALIYAASVAKVFKAKLTLLHVVEPVPAPDFSEAFPLAIENEQLMLTSKAQLETVLKDARIPDSAVEKTLVRFGRSFNEIAAAARERKVDLIIIATHGYTGLKHVLLGSTTERVVRHASCPVLVLRQS